MVKLEDVKFDCRHFKGHIPCVPNKKYGVVCECEYYDKTDKKILLIKLGAAGDVIRTTPLLFPLKKEFPRAKIFWLTYSPELIPVNTVPAADRVFKFNMQSLSYLESTSFDLLINLDKDDEAISLADRINAKEKKGFLLRDGVCYPADENAVHKFMTGIFDNISIENKKSYLEEIFEICGYNFRGEKYLIDIDKNFDRQWEIDKNKTVVGLNTGCGERWTSRLWKNEYWIELIKLLSQKNFEVILLGGPSEDLKNKELSEITGAKYFGTYDLRTFINLMDKCDIIVSQVTMAMHIAIALEKKLILMNNIFNPNEFELYNNGVIVQPQKVCKCFFQPVCINPDYRCMDHLMPEDVVNMIK